MHFAIHKQVAHQSEQDASINAKVRNRWISFWKSSERRGSKYAHRDQHQSSVKLGLPPPVDRKPEDRCERNYIEKLSSEKIFVTRIMIEKKMKTVHDDCCPCPHDRDESACTRTDPPEVSVQFDIV